MIYLCPKQKTYIFKIVKNKLERVQNKLKYAFNNDQFKTTNIYIYIREYQY
jgi:hypothetical protein